MSGSLLEDLLEAAVNKAREDHKNELASRALSVLVNRLGGCAAISGDELEAINGSMIMETNDGGASWTFKQVPEDSVERVH